MKSSDYPETTSSSRRNFLKKATMGLMGVGAMGLHRSLPARSTGENNETLRVIAYNVLQFSGFPREHSVIPREKGQMEQRLALELMLYDPDIITISESPGEYRVRELAGLMQMSYCFFPSAGMWPGAVFTRHRIVNFKNVPLLKGKRESDLFTRHWGKAEIALSNGRKIVVHSAHLYPGYQDKNNAIRAREITHMLKTLEKDVREHENVLLTGDLNHRPYMPEYQRWLDAGWVDSFSLPDEKDGYTIRSDKPYQRIDYILSQGTMFKRTVEGRPLYEGAFRTNPDDPGSYALSDHIPYKAVYEI